MLCFCLGHSMQKSQVPKLHHHTIASTWHVVQVKVAFGKHCVQKSSNLTFPLPYLLRSNDPSSMLPTHLLAFIHGHASRSSFTSPQACQYLAPFTSYHAVSQFKNCKLVVTLEDICGSHSNENECGLSHFKVNGFAFYYRESI